jgi:two-component system response regulator FlrC
MNILIAEDEPFVQDVLSIILRKAGHTVHMSSDGQEAWETFQKEAFDVVITDLDMPGLDGRELAAKVKDRIPGQPIILLTGEGGNGIAPPNVDYQLAKPIRGTALVDLLKRIAPGPLAVA